MEDKILIVDDDPRNIFALNATLKAKGFSCVTATGAVQGMKLLKEDSGIAIVLIDMMMPEMDGYEAIPLIKQIKPVPVIAVTAQAMVGDREKCIEVGANDYISKPVNVDQLLRLLDIHLKAV